MNLREKVENIITNELAYILTCITVLNYHMSWPDMLESVRYISRVESFQDTIVILVYNELRG